MGLPSWPVIADIFDGALVVAVVATVLTLGLSMTMGEVLASVRRRRLFVALILVNVLVIPVLAWAIATAMPLSRAQTAAMLVSTAGAGGAGGLKATQLARANLPLAVTLVIALQLTNLVVLPAWLHVALPAATIETAPLLARLVGLILVPLALSMLVRARWPGSARLVGPLVRLCDVSIVVALVAGVVSTRMQIAAAMHGWFIPSALLVVGVAMAMGALPGRRVRADRDTGALVSGMRFAALALIVIGAQSGDSATYLAPALVYALLDLAVAIGAGLLLGRRSRQLVPMAP